MLRDEQNRIIFLCRSLSEFSSMKVRLFREGKMEMENSLYRLDPDPAGPFLPQLLTRGTGVFVTPLGQVYGYASLEEGRKLIVGPSRMRNPEKRTLEEQLFLLGVPQEKRDAYVRALKSLPPYSPQRMGWLMGFFKTAVEGEMFPMETLSMEEVRLWETVREELMEVQQTENWETDTEAARDRSFEIEKMLLSFIRQGEPDRIGGLFAETTDIYAGKMAEDTLRQMKNTCVCMAAVASRAAIEGGMDSRSAFRMSDLYIQKAELLREIPALERLRVEICLDYAREVRRIRSGTGPGSGEGGMFKSCAEYVAKNLYAPIRVEEIARSLGYTRSYLSTCFRRQTGMTLTRYILGEKVREAQRMLEFTDKSLSEIADLFSFSSQSHFQNVFRKITGMTPLAYRRQRK